MLLVSQSFHVLQLLVGELQLLLVVAVLLHFGLKVMELLLNEQGKGGGSLIKRGEHAFASPSITCADAQEQPICISSSDMKGNVSEKRQAECFTAIN